MARKIVPPAPQPKAIAEVRPDLDPPNHEVVIADLRMNASVFVTDLPSLLPSTTSPVTVHGPELTKRIPETKSMPAGKPTPARVLSISDLRLDQGTIPLPPANETSATGTTEAITPAATANPQRGEGDQANQQNGMGVGEAPDNQSGQGAGPDNPGQQALTRIVRPKDGKFGVVVVGSSMAEAYPETSGLWGSRMAYTVYLHVGLTRNWILQYSLPLANSTADNGSVARLEAPWPFVMERPELAPGDVNGDAIMVHGFINPSGRFEKLTILFPADFAQSKFVLDALQQWQFRAAVQNGLLTAVEVLLIIPAEME